MSFWNLHSYAAAVDTIMPGTLMNKYANIPTFVLYEHVSLYLYNSILLFNCFLAHISIKVRFTNPTPSVVVVRSFVCSFIHSLTFHIFDISSESSGPIFWPNLVCITLTLAWTSCFRVIPISVLHMYVGKTPVFL